MGTIWVPACHCGGVGGVSHFWTSYSPKLALAARMRQETTLPIRWIEGRPVARKGEARSPTLRAAERVRLRLVKAFRGEDWSYARERPGGRFPGWRRGTPAFACRLGIGLFGCTL